MNAKKKGRKQGKTLPPTLRSLILIQLNYETEN